MNGPHDLSALSPTRGPLDRAPKLPEARFQQMVVRAAAYLGWQHMFVRTSRVRNDRHATATNVPGWPDLYLWSEAQQRRIHAELKSDTGRVRPEQKIVMESLRSAGAEVYLWRPRDWDDLVAILKGASQP